MLFNSLTFACFFATVLALHSLPFSWTVRKFNLLIASYLFYAAWNPPFVLLIWFSTLVDWHVAKRMMIEQRVHRRRLLLITSLGCNLGLLGFFKYGNFMVENFTAMVRATGIDYTPAAPSIILPVGISFYTFQTLSYTLDVYAGKAKSWKSFLDFALFVTFFPQLVAGPIVRAVSFLPQCIEPRRATARQLSWGLTLLVVGLFEKIVIADSWMAPISDRVFDATERLDFLTAWAGSLAFSAQIFCDFAGYSTCAIGAALCLGFSLPDNFRFPYAAIGFSDFWRRWHISLSSWLRDYLYISLGGNRLGTVRMYFNLMATMLIGGLWHGASWTFVFWGGLHGTYLVVERLLQNVRPPWALWDRWFVKLGLALATYALVCVTWVFFRAAEFDRAFAHVASMAGIVGDARGSLLGIRDLGLVALTTAVLLGIHWWMRDMSLEAVADRCPWWMRSVVIAVMLACICVFAYGGDRAFIYFQF